MGEYGKRLVDLHLLLSTELEPPIVKYQGKGNYKVEQLKYEDQERQVYVNKSQYFEKIGKDIWDYQIGGYQVCEKWLKERKGNTLSLNEIMHYCKIITAIRKTFEIQNKIDEIYPEVENEIIEF